jgi:hypothetical protein
MALFSSADKRDIVEQVNRLETLEQEDVFLILKSHGVFFSQNCNGVFINMKNVNDAIIAEIVAYLKMLQERKHFISQAQAEHIKSGFAQPLGEPVDSDGFGPAATATLASTPSPPDTLDTQSRDVVRTFIDNLENNGGTSSKAFYTKFQTAKKKYSKPCSRTEDGQCNNQGLTKQGYLL